ncbi:hypothetical protein FQZ97_835340 [compost metagenome]
MVGHVVGVERERAVELVARAQAIGHRGGAVGLIANGELGACRTQATEELQSFDHLDLGLDEDTDHVVHLGLDTGIDAVHLHGRVLRAETEHALDGQVAVQFIADDAAHVGRFGGEIEATDAAFELQRRVADFAVQALGLDRSGGSGERGHGEQRNQAFHEHSLSVVEEAPV